MNTTAPKIIPPPIPNGAKANPAKKKPPAIGHALRALE
jgi:hypothetical protein